MFYQMVVCQMPHFLMFTAEMRYCWTSRAGHGRRLWIRVSGMLKCGILLYFWGAMFLFWYMYYVYVRVYIYIYIYICICAMVKTYDTTPGYSFVLASTTRLLVLGVLWIWSGDISIFLDHNHCNHYQLYPTMNVHHPQVAQRLDEISLQSRWIQYLHRWLMKLRFPVGNHQKSCRCRLCFPKGMVIPHQKRLGIYPWVGIPT